MLILPFDLMFNRKICFLKNKENHFSTSSKINKRVSDLYQSKYNAEYEFHKKQSKEEVDVKYTESKNFVNYQLKTQLLIQNLQIPVWKMIIQMI